jgi:hypothetical protein
MTFQWAHGELDWKSASFGTPTIGRLLDRVFGIKPHRIEGGESLLSTELLGDWILTWDPNGSVTGDPKASYVVTQEDIEAFERIVQEELIEIVDFELREVKRPVYVVKGTYKYTQVPDPDGKMRPRRSDAPDEIKLLIGSRQSSGSFVNFQGVLERIGEALRIPIIDETTTKPTKPQMMLNIYAPRPADATRSGDNRRRFGQSHHANRIHVQQGRAAGEDAVHQGRHPRVSGRWIRRSPARDSGWRDGPVHRDNLGMRFAFIGAARFSFHPMRRASHAPRIQRKVHRQAETAG